MKPATLIFLLLIFLISARNGGSIHAELSLPADPPAIDRPQIPAAGAFRALIVFVRFQDDEKDTAGGCTIADNAWPVDAELPSFAHHLLSADPDPPFADSTLTAYFYLQSSGNLVLYGDAYPEVVITDRKEQDYGDHREILQRDRLTREILIRIDPYVDFSRYDSNGDGYVDQIFFVIRRFNSLRIVPGGASGIANIGYDSNGAEFDGKKISASLSGSYNHYATPGIIIPQVDLVRLMAHEFGHQLWPEFRVGHLDPLTDNDIPSNDNLRVGYALMLGCCTTTADTRGDITMSAYERSLLPGWIRCTDLDADTTVSVGDVYTSGGCYSFPLENSGANREIFISNKQRIGYFDQIRRPASNNCGACQPIDHGLMSTGLLVEIVRNYGRFAARDVLPAGSELHRPTDCEFPHARTIYDNTLYSPSTSTQITPWTRPNINGFNTYPVDFEPSWQAITDIRYHDRETGEMVFDFVRDFRKSPVIRADSWMGHETSNQEITGTLVIESGATLTIAPGTRLKLAPDARIVVRGELVADDVTFYSDGEWQGIHYGPGSTDSTKNLDLIGISGGY